MLTLTPVTIDIDTSKDIFANDYCRDLFNVYPDYYNKVGYILPWIGYFVMRDNTVAGCCGFVEKPVNGRVEIAYGTRKEYEGQGIATFSCQSLTALALTTDSSLTVFAKIEPLYNASTTVLQRNGFVYNGMVQDHEIGDAWEWVYVNKKER